MQDVVGFDAQRDSGVGVGLVDSIPLFRDGFAALITRTSGLRWVGGSGDVRSALAMCERGRPEIVLVDPTLDPQGVLCWTLVHDHGVRTVVALFDGYVEASQQVANAIAHGARGIVARTAQSTALINTLARFHFGSQHFDDAPRPTVRSTATNPLSDREHQVFQLMAYGMESAEIARCLHVSTETVRTHVKHILRKLNARNRAHAVTVGFTMNLIDRG